ncbi:MAG TPA: hypothetical protein VGC77_07385 [Rhodopseudomonas sp.]|uniref:hypothetical protein n=1 Tax=Rhodopseudomonas sp. TaxID=1078 RepID=UPI002EDA6A3D
MKRTLIAAAAAGFLGLGLILPAAAMPASGLGAAATPATITDNVVEAQYGPHRGMRRGFGPRPGLHRGYGPRPGLYRGHRGPHYGWSRGRHRGWR